jgi:hypothetical protein
VAEDCNAALAENSSLKWPEKGLTKEHLEPTLDSSLQKALEVPVEKLTVSEHACVRFQGQQERAADDGSMQSNLL